MPMFHASSNSYMMHCDVSYCRMLYTMNDMLDFLNLFAVLITSEYFCFMLCVVRTGKEVQSCKFQVKMDQVEVVCLLITYLQEGWKSLQTVST